MAKKKLIVNNLEIIIDEVDGNDFINITDIIKNSTDNPHAIIQSWLKNSSTIRYLYFWERLHNPDFLDFNLDEFIGQTTDRRFVISPKAWVQKTNAIGLFSKAGRHGGGTFAHSDIAMEFCTWFSPEFKVYIVKEFRRMKEAEFEKQSLQWHLSMITDRVDEIRNFLDTVPHQLSQHIRISLAEEEE